MIDNVQPFVLVIDTEEAAQELEVEPRIILGDRHDRHHVFAVDFDDHVAHSLDRRELDVR